MNHRFQRRVLALIVLLAGQGTSLWAAPINSASKQADGALRQFSSGVLRLQVMSDAFIRVTYAAGDALPELRSHSVIATPSAESKWKMQETPSAIIIETRLLRAIVDRTTGAVGFVDLGSV